LGFHLRHIRSGLYIVFGMTVFGLVASGPVRSRGPVFWGSPFLLFMGAVGIIAAAFILVFKRGKSVGVADGRRQRAAGGVYFPVIFFRTGLTGI